MKTVSLCMIVKNEEKVLDKCLNSIKDVFDEIIIVDTGSNDNTVNIAKKYTHKIYNYKWNDDFASARNYSFSKSTCDYIMWLDADDYIEKEDKVKLKKLLSMIDGSIDMYYLLYEFNKDYEPFYRERIVKNNKNYLFVGKIHEVIIPVGKIEYDDIIIKQSIKEYKDISRNLKIYSKMDKSQFTNRDYYYYGRELFRNKKYNKAKVYLKKFLSLSNNYKEDEIDACYIISSIYIITSDYKSALYYLFLSFNYDTPRANNLCLIGDIYQILSDFEKAIYYYELALSCKINQKSFINKDYFNYYPSMQLCVCYYKIKDYNKAYEFNELANKYKHNTDIYEKNKKYLSSFLK